LNFFRAPIPGRQHCFISRTTKDREKINKPKDREFKKHRYFKYKCFRKKLTY
jgi:hypothetical protein